MVFTVNFIAIMHLYAISFPASRVSKIVAYVEPNDDCRWVMRKELNSPQLGKMVQSLKLQCRVTYNPASLWRWSRSSSKASNEPFCLLCMHLPVAPEDLYLDPRWEFAVGRSASTSLRLHIKVTEGISGQWGICEHAPTFRSLVANNNTASESWKVGCVYALTINR